MGERREEALIQEEPHKCVLSELFFPLPPSRSRSPTPTPSPSHPRSAELCSAVLSPCSAGLRPCNGGGICTVGLLPLVIGLLLLDSGLDNGLVLIFGLFNLGLALRTGTEERVTAAGEPLFAAGEPLLAAGEPVPPARIMPFFIIFLNQPYLHILFLKLI